jgi:2-phospho-L-lactate/phosphoenolpyruvate guanylyltransferase
MACAAILPVKRFGNAKQRLRESLGAGARQALASAMFADVLGALSHSSLIDTVLIVSGEREVSDLALEREVVLIGDETEKGQSAAALTGIARAAALGYDSALLVPGDTPLLDPLEVDTLISNAAVSDLEVVIVPDRHGHGTNAVLLDPSGPFQPQFGPGSLERHTEQARDRGLRFEVQAIPSLAIDVDTGEDLAELRRAFDAHHGRAPRTQGVIRQIERSRDSAIPA